MKLFRCASVKAIVMMSLMLAVTMGRLYADIRVTENGKSSFTQNGKGVVGKANAAWTRTTEIKGSKMRRESTSGGESRVTIYDLEVGKRFRLNASTKEVYELDLGPVSKLWIERIRQKSLVRVVRPDGKKDEVSGLSCDEYTFELHALSVGSLHGYEVKQLARDSGTVCISKTIAAGNELLNFVHEALKRGYGLAAAAVSPTYSPVGQYFFGEEPNLMVLSATTESGYESDLDKGRPTMAAIASTSSITEISVGSIPDQNFRIPTDWKVKKDKEFDSLR